MWLGFLLFSMAANEARSSGEVIESVTDAATCTATNEAASVENVPCPIRTIRYSSGRTRSAKN